MSIWTAPEPSSRIFSATTRGIKNVRSSWYSTVKGNPGEVLQYHNIHVIFTKEAETADQYIEKVTQQIGRRYQVAVATSDRLEQVIILGKGAMRLSARDLFKEISETNQEIHTQHLERIPSQKNRLFDNVDPALMAYLEDVRLNRILVEEPQKPTPTAKKKKAKPSKKKS